MFSLKKISQNNNYSISLFINYILPILLIGIGMFQTYREAFLLWYGQRDELTHPLLINEINQHGWSFINNYQFPIDNWFFTLILPYKLIYSLFGNNLTVITATGPVIFWLTALFTGFIVNYITKNKIKALWACAFILMAPQTALWGGGYLVHSVAHHISVLWGMGALLCYFLWIDYKNYIALISAIILLSLATFSDPWLLPTFDLPILCASLSMIYLDKKEKFKNLLKIWINILASIFFIILIYKTHFFSFFILSNVTESPFLNLKFSFPSLFHVFEIFSYYFDFIPFCDLTKFPLYWAIKNIPHIILTLLTILFNGSVLLSSISFIIYKIFQNIKHQNKVTNFLFFFLIFSTLGIISSLFVFGTLKHFYIENFGNVSIYAASHFIINLFYAFIILAFILPFFKISHYSQKWFIFLGAMFICTGLISNEQVWNFKKTHTSFPQEKKIISILEKNNIHYAFGWSPELDQSSEIINFLTSHIIFHPIVKGEHAFSLGFWLSPSYYRIPPHQKWAFLLPDQQKGAEKADCDLFLPCIEAIIHQFGQPLEIKHQDYITYFIYNSDQTDILHHLNFPPLTQKDLSHWQSYYPNDQLNLNQLITIDGWKWEHIYNREIQSDQEWASFIVPITKPQPHLHLRIKLKSSTPTARNIDLLYRNDIIAQWRVSDSEAIQEFNISINSHEKNPEFKIHILNPDSSKKYGLMGIMLSEVQVVEDENN